MNTKTEFVPPLLADCDPAYLCPRCRHHTVVGEGESWQGMYEFYVDACAAGPGRPVIVHPGCDGSDKDGNVSIVVECDSYQRSV